MQKIFIRGLPQKLKDFANKRQVKHNSSSLEPSMPFHTLVNMVDSEDITLEKIKTQELSIEINSLSDNLKNTVTLNDTTSPPVNQLGQNDPKNKTKPQFKKYCTFYQKNNRSVSTCFRRLNLIKDRSSHSKSPTPSFYQHFKNYRPK